MFNSHITDHHHGLPTCNYISKLPSRLGTDNYSLSCHFLSYVSFITSLDPREKKLYGIVTYIEYTAATPDARWSQKSSSVQQNQT